ncbi:MAG: DeoR/GlpR transcriptional regulator [Opitutaceae bacterium]|nr:DeoR/GlpR transcriptional regulator [Opitutaceae bacterium]
MLTAERHQAILQILAKQGRITVADIARLFSISAATARRDAVLLSEAGMAVRSHGGLLPAHFFRDASRLPARLVRPSEPNARIARRALELVPQEGNVFVDSDNTCLEVGRLLIEQPDLCIFTNSIPLIGLASQSSASLTAIGGEIKKGSTALTGELAQAWLSDLRFDIAIIGASRLDPVKGAYTHDFGQVAIKREAMQRANVRMLVADGDKWKRSDGIHFAAWGNFSHFVTSDDPPSGVHEMLGTKNIKVHVSK